MKNRKVVKEDIIALEGKLFKAMQGMGTLDKPEILGQKGIALVMVLIISVIALAVMAALIYMLTAGTQISGVHKRYKTALEGGLAGADITYQFIADRGQDRSLLDPALYNFVFTASEACMRSKLNNSNADWDPSCDYSIFIDPDDPTTYDMTFVLGPTAPDPTDPQNYKVYAKISNTVEGNTGPGGRFEKGGVVDSGGGGGGGGGEIKVQSIPYLYTIEIDTENAVNRAERAKLSILYQF